MNRKPYLLPVIVFLLVGTGAVGAEENPSLSPMMLNGFELYVNCQPVHVIVEDPTPDAQEIGLTKTRIMTAAEARLRGARIFSEKMTAPLFLHIHVSVARQAFHIGLSFSKVVVDSFSLKDNFASTWTRDTVGTHTSDSSYILSRVSELIDQFIVEYFLANQAACDQKP